MTNSKDDLRGGYAVFLKTPSGKDFLDQIAILEKAFILQGMKATTAEEKAFAVCRVEGIATIRDYMLRMSKSVK